MVAEILTKQIGVNYKKDLYQLLLRVYLCQRWIVEFKGIMQPVLFMIFFLDFVTPQKRTRGILRTKLDIGPLHFT